MVTRPGGQMASRPLHFIWILDCSGSMNQDGKIQTLNMAIRQATPSLQSTAAKHPEAQVLIRAVRFFQRTAEWHIPQPTLAQDFNWQDVTAEGETPMGRALALVAEELKVPPMAPRAIPPVLILVSDGQPTDDFEGGLRVLMNQPWGAKAVRLAIGVGRDVDTKVLQKFIGHPERQPLQANNPDALVTHIKTLSTVVLDQAAVPKLNENAGDAIRVPPLPNDALSDTTW